MNRNIKFGSLFILAMFFIPYIGMDAEAGVNPIWALTVALEPASQTSEPTPSVPGTAEYTGKVQIDKLPVERVVVSLTATVGNIGGASAIVTPSSIVITTLQPYAFKVAVTVPQASNALMIGTVTVDAKGQGGGQIKTATTAAEVRVKQYFRLSITSDSPYKEISPGSQVFYSFKVWNSGNGMDRYVVNVHNQKELTEKGWVISLGATVTQDVNPNEYVEVRLTCQSPRTWTLYKSEPTMIVMKLESDTAKLGGLSILQDYSLYAWERGFYIPGFDPFFLIIAFAICIIILNRK
ncbi:MAG: choice-of-anchor T family protein [Candidatus Thermoplasmatota archaeon]